MTVSILLLSIYFFLKENVSISCDESNSPPALNTTEGLPECIPTEGLFDPEVVDKLGWMPLASLIIYILFFAVGKTFRRAITLYFQLFTHIHSQWSFLGFGQIPWTINAEIFPLEAKALSSSIAFGFNWFCGFLVTKFYPDLEKLIGPSGAYLLFACICAFGKSQLLTSSCHFLQNRHIPMKLLFIW